MCIKLTRHLKYKKIQVNSRFGSHDWQIRFFNNFQYFLTIGREFEKFLGQRNFERNFKRINNLGLALFCILAHFTMSDRIGDVGICIYLRSNSIWSLSRCMMQLWEVTLEIEKFVIQFLIIRNWVVLPMFDLSEEGRLTPFHGFSQEGSISTQMHTMSL